MVQAHFRLLISEQHPHLNSSSSGCARLGSGVARVLLCVIELELIQSHMAQKPVLRGEVGCACVARKVSVERGGMGVRVSDFLIGRLGLPTAGEKRVLEAARTPKSAGAHPTDRVSAERPVGEKEVVSP